MKFLKNENGQSMVEFALVLPLLLLILCGIIDFGWIFYNQLSLENCVRDTARYGAVNAGNSECSTLVLEKANNIAVSSIKENMSVQVTFSNPYEPCEGDITVYITSEINILTPVVGVFFNNQKVNLSSSVTMKAES